MILKLPGSGSDSSSVILFGFYSLKHVSSWRVHFNLIQKHKIQILLFQVKSFSFSIPFETKK